MVCPNRPAVDKLRAVEVLVPNVKAAEDLNLRPLATAPAALGTRALLHAPHQPPNLTFKELIVPSVGYISDPECRYLTVFLYQIPTISYCRILQYQQNNTYRYCGRYLHDTYL
jgi:hypothetical protein